MTTKTWEITPTTNQEHADTSGLSQLSQSIASLPPAKLARSQPPRGKSSAVLGRKRTIARMVRVELEITLRLLNQALEQAQDADSCPPPK